MPSIEVSTTQNNGETKRDMYARLREMANTEKVKLGKNYKRPLIWTNTPEFREERHTLELKWNYRYQ